MRSGLKCQALDIHGRRCRSDKRLVAVNYHGHSEIYGSGSDGPEPTWVRVYLCDKHRTKRRASHPGEER
jgi:hypothetical protein